MANYSWFKLNYKIQNLLDTLVENIEEQNCFDTTELKTIKKEVSWFNTPVKVGEIITYLEDRNYITGIEKPQWYRLYNTIEELQEVAENFDCFEIEVPEGINTVQLTEYAPDGDLNPPNDTVDITLYFEGESPVQGTQLYLNPSLGQVFEDGGSYLTSEETPIQISNEGEVEDIGFEIPDTEDPTAPTNLTVGNITPTSIELEWNPSTDDTGVSFYQVIENGTEKETTENTNFTVTSLEPETEYTYIVTAEDEAGNVSDPSNEVSATTLELPDTTPPSVPTNLSSDNITQTTVDLSWTASTDDKEVSHYVIYQDNTENDTTTSTTYNVTGLDPETEYSFTVSAVDTSENESAESSVETITTLQEPDTTPPSVPTNLTSSNVTQTEVTLTWSPSTDNRGVSSYNVYQDGTVVENITGTEVTIDGLTPETEYTFTVSAIDTSDNESTQSTSEVVTTLPVPDTTPPSVPSDVTSSNITQTEATLSWSASTDDRGVASYNVYQNGSVVENTTNTQITIDGLTADTEYSFTISAIDTSDNESDQSTATVVNTLPIPDTTPPSVPTGLSASNTTQTTTSLSWTASTDNEAVANYKVFQDGVEIDTTTNTTYEATGLTADTEYEFTVSAIDTSDNESAQSTAITVNTLPIPDTTPPSVPTGLTAGEITDTTAEVSWTTSTDDTGVEGYNVYVDGVLDQTVEDTTAEITDLETLLEYSITVSAFDAEDNESAQSEPLVITTL